MATCAHCGKENREGGLYCAACGCSLGGEGRPFARLVWQDEATREEKTYLISETERFVGRDTVNDIVVDDEQASARHVKLSFVDGAFQAADLGSKNGTFVNGERIEGARKLEDEDLVKIGRTIFKFSRD